MSHSKQTANYGLPLFEPKDRPAWLTDFNGAMTAVDATVKGLEDSIQAGGLPLTGGTMQGSINMGDHAITNVQEVELQSSGDGLYIGSVVQPSGTAGARLTGVAGGAAAFVKPDSQSIYVPVSVGSPSQDKHAATKEYVDTAIAGIPASGITQEQADARYLQLSGGTMAGDLKVQESPASAASAVSKSYAQGLFASALPKSGGTMTGPLVLSGAPTADNQAATKAYVDGHISPAKTIVGSVSTTYTERTKEPTVTFTIDYTLIDPAKPIIYELQLTNVTLYIGRSGNVAVGIGSTNGYKRLLVINTVSSGTYTFAGTIKTSLASQIEFASFNASGDLTGYSFLIYPNQLSIQAIDGDEHTFAYVESGTVTLTIYQ